MGVSSTAPSAAGGGAPAYRGKAAALSYNFLPTGTSGVTVTTLNGTVWQYGAYVDLITAAANTTEKLIYGVAFATGAANNSELKIASGAAGSEAALAVVPVGSSAIGKTYIFFPIPIRVLTGVRISAAAAGDTQNFNITGVKLLYIDPANIEAF